VIGDDETLFVGSSNGMMYALDTVAGGVRWLTSIGASVERAPALADGVLYVASTDGRLSAVPAGGCGAVRCPASWSTETGAATSVQPAVAGGVVYVGATDGTLRAFDADGCGRATCPPLWTANVGSAIDGGLAVFGGKLYVGAQAALVAYGLPR
jgi:outer membrane protein assembly factor BamB